MNGRVTKNIMTVIIFLLCSLILLIWWGTIPADYETQDIADYGQYIGNAEQYMTEYIERFFPEEISEDFKNVRYVFHSRKVDEYGFEAFLEFTFENVDKFNSHVELATVDLISQPFYFDNTFQEYTVHDEDSGFVYDHIQLGRTYYDEEIIGPYYQIHYADIAKILVNYSEHRVIYIAMAVHDGGGSDTALLGTFFERFSIDPIEYEEYTDKYVKSII